MAGESQQAPNLPLPPVPDPTRITTEQILREVEHLRDKLETRIDGLEARVDERYETQMRAREEAVEALRSTIAATKDASDKAIDKALDAAEKAVNLRQDQADKEFHEHLEQVRHENRLAFENADKAVASALAAQKEAVVKAEIATEKRFESVNEFRAQLNDQARLFMPRSESIGRHDATTEKIADLVTAEAKARDVLSERVTALALSQERMSAQGQQTYVTRAAYDQSNQALVDRVTGLTDRMNISDGKGAGVAALYGWIVAGIGLLISVIVLANMLFK